MGMSSQGGSGGGGMPPGMPLPPMSTGQKLGMGFASALNGAAMAADPNIQRMDMPGMGQSFDEWNNQRQQFRQDRRDLRHQQRGGYGDTGRIDVNQHPDFGGMMQPPPMMPPQGQNPMTNIAPPTFDPQQFAAKAKQGYGTPDFAQMLMQMTNLQGGR